MNYTPVYSPVIQKLFERERMILKYVTLVRVRAMLNINLLITTATNNGETF